MLIVTPEAVGRVAYGRMARDGVIRSVLPGRALPADVIDAPPLRRTLLATLVPCGAQATGLAAAWAHGCGALPTVLQVRTAAGRRVRSARLPLALEQHAVGLAHVDDGSPARIAPLEVALVDALRWSGTADALTAVRAAVASGATSLARLEAVVDETCRVRVPEGLSAAWSDVVRAIGAAPSLGGADAACAAPKAARESAA
ncbi:hypothetical protein [Demequina sp. NBRC 110056]|uniref:hypothetical protein n=1 Tax=Demequina sp. NBRC 110056 TaxID=1570345 RepID=UPI0009FF05E0|nr:hypothetical protein [Demequina sp. NBRC 110056]